MTGEFPLMPLFGSFVSYYTILSSEGTMLIKKSWAVKFYNFVIPSILSLQALIKGGKFANQKVLCTIFID